MRKLNFTICLAAGILVGSTLLAAEPRSSRGDQLVDLLPPNALLRMGTVRFRSPTVVKELLLADEGKILISAGGYVTGWDAESGRQLWRHPQQVTGNRIPTSYGVKVLALLPDGKRFLTSAPNGGILVWDAATGQYELSAQKQPTGFLERTGFGSCISIDVGPAGKRFAIGNMHGMNVTDEHGNIVFGINGGPQEGFVGGPDRLRFGGAYCYGIFSPDGTILAVVDNGAATKIRLLDAKSGEEKTSIDCTDRVVRMDFSPDSETIVATERDTAVRLYEVKSGNRIWENVFDVDKSIENYTSAIKFSPNGKLIAVAERSQRLDLLDAASGRQIGQFKNHSWNPWAIAFTADSKTIYSSGWGGTIHRWNAETVEQIPVPGAILGTGVVAAAADNETLAYADQSGVIRLVSKTSGKELRHFTVADAGYEYLKFSPAGKQLAAGGTCDGKVHLSLWDYHEGKLIYRWDWEPGRDPLTGIEEIDFTTDGRLIAAAAFRQSAAHLFDATTGKRIFRLAHPQIYGLDFSADDDKLITAGWDSQVRFWDVASGEQVDLFQIPEDEQKSDLRMYTVSTEHTGQLLATTHLSGAVKIWNSDSRELRSVLKPPNRFHYGSTCFSPDGLWFAIGDATGNIEIWDPWTGNQIHQLEGHEASVYTLDFGGNNLTLCSGGDNVGYCWDLRPADIEIDESTLWESLSGADGTAAYSAWWVLLDGGDTSVRLLREKTAAISEIVDTGRLATVSDAKQRERRNRLLNMMVDKNDKAIRLVAAKRIISLLSHIDTDKAQQLLAELANHDDDLGKLAAKELRRRGYKD